LFDHPWLAGINAEFAFELHRCEVLAPIGGTRRAKQVATASALTSSRARLGRALLAHEGISPSIEVGKGKEHNDVT